jgi:RimJ/RimL family protein N-acetyltransferase
MKKQTQPLSLVPYSLEYLDLSWHWLNDPEIRELTMTPAFTREQQRAFFESLACRTNYHVWGVALDGKPIGAAGLKNQRNELAEYWGYLGEKEYWGMGLGRELILLVEDKAMELGLSSLELKVSKKNLHAIRLYQSMGFVTDETMSNDYVLKMVKRSIQC